MTVSRQRQWLTDLLEGLPSIVFILLWRQGGDLELAGWAGSGLALVVFGVFSVLRARMNPVLLGVNLHILFVTPLIVGVFKLGLEDLGRMLVSYAHSAVLLTVLVTGVCLSVFSKRGFVSAELPLKQLRYYSALMLTGCGFGTVWAFLVPSQTFIAVVATLTLLIFGRRFLLAQWADRADNSDMIAVSGLSNPEQIAAHVST